MKNILQHKGYAGNVQFDPDGMIFYGRVMGMKKAHIAYEGRSVDDLVKDFRDAIDDYLEICAPKKRLSLKSPSRARLIFALIPNFTSVWLSMPPTKG